MPALPAPEALLRPVCTALDALLAAAQPYGGLFPSLLDRQTGAMLTELPPSIAGQRIGDRAHRGCNLIHDTATLATLYGLGAALGRADYTAAATAYLHRFATHCTGTATGLFPWGEHAFWHLAEDRLGNGSMDSAGGKPCHAIHDHLRHAPRWLWEQLWAANPECVVRFAEGLDGHWTAGTPREYIRHAIIDERLPHPRGNRSCDFPRHGGFYICDWAFAWRRSGRADFRAQLVTMLDYWWEKRDARGLLLIESRSPADAVRFLGINAPGQTLSLAASLLETAAFVAEHDAALAATLRERAGVYVEGFLAAPHDLARGVYVILSRRDDNTVTEAMPVWGSKYGLWPASYVALTAICVHRLTGDPRLLAWAEAVGRDYLAQPFPDGVAVPAMDAGLGLGLLADLYHLTGDTAWRDGALRLAGELLSRYCDAPLPRGAAGIAWYESQMGPGFLLHGLARTALLAQDRAACPLAADYTAR
jgi:hypothetical protein